MMDRTLYHGSSVIVEQPLASIGRRDLDFGPGFYLTPLREHDMTAVSGLSSDNSSSLV